MYGIDGIVQYLQVELFPLSFVQLNQRQCAIRGNLLVPHSQGAQEIRHGRVVTGVRVQLTCGPRGYFVSAVVQYFPQ